jgi:hypothetical protein
MINGKEYGIDYSKEGTYLSDLSWKKNSYLKTVKNHKFFRIENKFEGKKFFRELDSIITDLFKRQYPNKTSYIGHIKEAIINNTDINKSKIENDLNLLRRGDKKLDDKELDDRDLLLVLAYKYGELRNIPLLHLI